MICDYNNKTGVFKRFQLFTHFATKELIYIFFTNVLVLNDFSLACKKSQAIAM